MEVRIGKLRNEKNEVTEVMIKYGAELVIDWIWKLCKMAF